MLDINNYVNLILTFLGKLLILRGNDETVVTIMINYNALQKVGLKKNEAKIYLTLIELGETTIIPLAKSSELPRTTCYSVLDKMIKKGLVSWVSCGAHTYFSAASPEKIKEMAIMNERKSIIQKKLAEDLIPKLSQVVEKSSRRPRIQYFTGRKGVRAIFEDLLSSGEVKDFYIGSLDYCVDAVGERFIKDWVKRRINAGIFSYGIRNKPDEILATTFKSNRRRFREIRLAPTGFESPAYICLYGKKIALITSKEEGFGLIIESEDFYKTLKSMFDVLWRNSKTWSKKIDGF